MNWVAKDIAEKKQNIIALNVDSLNEDTLARLPNVETLCRDVRRNRNAIHPIVPDAQDTLFIIPPNYMVNALGQQFLMYDNQRQDRILLFSTPESLRFLANADNWFMDGTFKSSPQQFTQLYTIHGLSSGRNVVGAYALLPDKRMATYAEMLTQIQRLMNNVIPQSVMIDFELSMLGPLPRYIRQRLKLDVYFIFQWTALNMYKNLGFNKSTWTISFLELISEWYQHSASFQSKILLLLLTNFPIIVVPASSPLFWDLLYRWAAMR